MGLKVLISHYRIGRTDGVSLEIQKRVDVLKHLGCDVVLAGGPVSSGVDYIIDDLEFDSLEINRIKKNAFTRLTDYPSGSELLSHINRVAERIYHKLKKIAELENPDVLMIHNILSHGRHIAAAKGYYYLIRETGLQTLSTHHDFYWERPEFIEATCPEITDYLQKYVPIKHEAVQHAVINSIAKRNLSERSGMESIIIPDTFDFNQTPWVEDYFSSSFLEDFNLQNHDIIFIQATRIVERKNVESAIDLIKELSGRSYMERLQDKTLYNGKKTDKSSRVVLLVAGYAEEDSIPYFERLKEYAAESGIEVRFIGARVGVERSFSGGKKIYSLWDCYVFSDAVVYPSIIEGWGNQFIEAVFARLPVVLFEYHVFKTDIAPLGFNYISLGDRFNRNPENRFVELPGDALQDAAEKITDLLLNPSAEKLMEENFVLGKKNNSYEHLEMILKGWLPG